MVRKHLTTGTAAAIVCLFCSTAFAQIGGSVDWVARVVKAKGVGAVNPNMPVSTARPGAIRAAKQIALRDALELVKGISLNSSTTIANSMTTNDAVNSNVNGFVKGFTFEPAPHYMSDGTVEIEVTIPIDGVSGLGSALFGGAGLISETPSATITHSGAPAKGFSGLIIDAKGLGIKPTLMPRITDEKDMEIYGSAYVSREFAVKFGMCGYVKNLADAQKNTDRIGATPFVVKGIKATGANKTDIVLSTADAATVQSTAQNAKFLSECRVIVLID